MVPLETQKSFKYNFQNLCYLNFSGVLGVPIGETADLAKGTAERAPEATRILARGTARICKFRVRIGCDDAGVAPMVGAQEKTMETMKMVAALALMLLGGGSVILSMFAALIPGGMDTALAMLMGGSVTMVAAAVLID